MEKQGIQIVAVAGSVRPRNFTSKALGLVLDEVKRREDVTLDAIDLASIELPPPGTGDSKDGKRIKPGFPFCLPLMARLYTRSPPIAQKLRSSHNRSASKAFI